MLKDNDLNQLLLSRISYTECHVVAVHGLGGDSEGTWTYDDDGEEVMWLRDLLPAHLTLILNFSYTLSCKKGISAASIRDIAVRLLDELHVKSKFNDDQNRPIVFIGHDLGGVIIKQALLIAAGSQHHSTIAARTSHLVFFGTPHRNSESESWESIAFRLLLMAGQTFDGSLNYVLEETSQTLSWISNDFLKMPRIYGTINCFERPRRSASTLGFSPHLAKLGIYGEKCIEKDKSHANICKIHDMSDTALSLIVNSISGTAISLASSFTAQYLTLASKPTSLREQYLDCLRTLSMPASKVYLPGVISLPLKTTQWITNHDAYKALLDQSQLLWLHGGGGSRIYEKASLLANIASTKLPGASIIRFSFDSTDERHGSTYRMLASLSYQILSLKPSLFDHVLLLYEKISEEMPWRLDRIWAFFRSLLSCPHHGVTICLIDRVDECEDTQDRFLTELLLLPDHKNRNLKLVVTSRVEPDSNIHPHAATMTIGMEEVKPEDMPSMLVTELSDLTRIRPALSKFEDTIKKTLQTPSLNSLTAALTLKLLQSSKTQTTYSLIVAELSTIPSTLTELYRYFISKIPIDRYKWARKVLTWIIHAKRPLQLRELAVALVLEDEIPSISYLQSAIPQELALDLENVFGQLIKIKNDEISLIDRSLRDLLLEGKLGPVGEIWTFDDHYTLAEACLKYLSLISKEWQTQNPHSKQPSILENHDGELCLHFPLEDKGQYDFVPYAVQYWPRHYNSHNKQMEKSQQVKREDVDQNQRDEHAGNHDVRHRARDFWMEEGLMEIWSQLHWYYEIPIKQQQLSLKDPLLVACQLQCADLVNTILKTQSSSLHLSTGLEIAIENGDDVIVDLLISYGAQSKLALHKAAQHGHNELVTRFIGEKFQVTAVDPGTGSTPLHLASTAGYYSVVELLLAALPTAADIDAMNNDGCTALHLASQFGHTEVMEKLLLKANPNARGSHSFTPLHVSSQWQQPCAVALLLKKSADSGADDKYGQTPLHIAAGSGRVDITETFLQHNPLLTATGNVAMLNKLLGKTDKQARTALHVAAGEGHADVVRLLLDASSEYPGATSMGDSLGRTPLHLAVQNGHRGVVEALLAKDRIMEEHAGSGNQTSIERVDRQSSVPIHLGVQKGQTEIVELLCKEHARLGVPVDILNSSALSPLHMASAAGVGEIVKALLRCGAEVNIADKVADKPLILACRAGHLDVVKVLLGAGADPVCTNAAGRSPLHEAADAGKAKVARMLLDTFRELNDGKGYPDLRDNQKRTALHLAAANGHPEIISMLLNETGFDMDAVDEKGCSVLGLASECRQFAVLQLLVDKIKDNTQTSGDENAASHSTRFDKIRAVLEAAPNPVEGDILRIVLGLLDIASTHNLLGYSSVLHLAARRGIKDVVEKILNMDGADPNTKNDSGATPLITAAAEGKTEIVKMLLMLPKVVAEQDHQDDAHRSALAYAAKCGHLEVVKLLATCQGNGSRTSRSAMAYAADEGHYEVVEWLLQNPSAANRNLVEQSRQQNESLLLAVPAGRDRVAKLLLDHRADPNVPNESGSMPLQIAACNRHAKVVRVLLESGKVLDINAQGAGRRTATYEAAWGGDVAVMDLLLEHGTDIEIPAENGWRPLHAATDSLPVVKSLLAKHVSVDSQVVSTLETPLYLAIKSGNEDVARELLSSGKANPATQTATHSTPLHAAARYGSDKFFRFILDRWPSSEDMNLQDSDGQTPFLIAVSKGKGDSVKALLDVNDKIDLNQRAKDGKTPLWIAINAGSVEVVKVLLESPKMDINSPCEDVEALIHHAVSRKSISNRAVLVGLLLDKEPKINCRSDVLFSAAAEIDDVKLNKFLIEGGADKTRTDVHGWTLAQVVATSQSPLPATLTSAAASILSFEPPTSWNPEDASKVLKLNTSGGMPSMIRYVGDNTNSSSWRQRLFFFYRRSRNRPGAVRANHPIPPVDQFCFEMRVIDDSRDCEITIGFGHKTAPLDAMPGQDPDTPSWGYSSEGALFHKGNRRPAAPFREGDEIRCHIDPATGTAIFRKNNETLDVRFEGITGRLYPMIGLSSRGAEVWARFTSDTHIEMSRRRFGEY